MRRVVLAIAVALCLAPAVEAAERPEPYLAYRVRLARGETHYRLDAGLSVLATKRAREYAMNPERTTRPHRHLREVPCRWGEILGWSMRDRLGAVRWTMAAWRRSPTHEAVLTGRWARYGVGMYRLDGAWFMAVIFADCRL